MDPKIRESSKVDAALNELRQYFLRQDTFGKERYINLLDHIRNTLDLLERNSKHEQESYQHRASAVRTLMELHDIREYDPDLHDYRGEDT